MKTIKYLFYLIIAVIILGMGILFFPVLSNFSNIVNKAMDWNEAKSVAYQFLSDEQISFLVTNRIVTVVTADSRESNWLLGERIGNVTAEVAFYWGINMEEFSSDSIEVENEKLVIYLPDPKLLDYSVKIDTVRYMTQMNVSMFLKDKITNKNLKDELLLLLYNEAKQFPIKRPGDFPSKSIIIFKLGKIGSLISSKTGREVEFR
jgi:hypothetical protein